jgi:hypothetical protein
MVAENEKFATEALVVREILMSKQINSTNVERQPLERDTLSSMF